MSVRGCVHLWFLSEAWRVATAQRLGWAPSPTERQLVAREDEVSIESYGGQRFRIFFGGDFYVWFDSDYRNLSHSTPGLD